MSEDELVRAYSAGIVSRRVFIRRLVAAGVSMTAALAYAEFLEPDAASAAKSPTRGHGKHGHKRGHKRGHKHGHKPGHKPRRDAPSRGGLRVFGPGRRRG